MRGVTDPSLLPEETDIASSIMLLYLTGGLAVGAALSFVRPILYYWVFSGNNSRLRQALNFVYVYKDTARFSLASWYPSTWSRILPKLGNRRQLFLENARTQGPKLRAE